MACDVETCSRKHYARGWCRAHYQRWRRHGDPTAGTYRGRGSAYERVVDRLVADGDCLLFSGARSKNGYGQIRDGNRLMYTHRIVLIHHTGERDGNVLHSCDNRACCNVEHLRWGTQVENAQDMAARGRGWWQR